jgi:hypothetical protein
VWATWVRWGTALVLVIAVARHVAASRRRAQPVADRDRDRCGSADCPVPVAAITWLWLHRDRTQIDLGPIVFSDELVVEIRNADPPQLFGLLGSITGRMRLLVGGNTIETRGVMSGGIKVSGFGTPGTFGLLDYTFRAEDCEVERRGWA